jgi:hypothetical protein
MEYLAIKDEIMSFARKKRNGTGKHHVKQNKPGSEKPVFSHLQNLKP